MEGTCSVEGCTRTVRAIGMCGGHMSRYYKTGDPGSPILRERHPAPSACTVDGCDRKPQAKGFWLTGIILGFVSIAIAIIYWIFLAIIFASIANYQGTY